MKYCVDFDTRFQYINEIDEVIIKYNKQKADALKYIQEHPKNCVILYIDNVEDKETKKELNKLSQIALEHPEFNFKVEFAEMIYNIQKYNYHFKYFFHTYVNTWDRFVGILNLGVSDIYIIDELGFGKLNEIILNLDENDKIDLDSRYIIPRFAEARVKCGKKCLKGNNCQICERIYELSQSLEKAKLIVRKKEEEK